MTGDRRRVVVVGGGITGLATAWFLRARHGIGATVHEASNRLGGKVRTDELAGVAVEAGPDTFLARVPEAVNLCRELGLPLLEPATTKAYVWTRGALRPLPEGLVLGVPTSTGPLRRSGIVSRRGTWRAAADLVLPRTRLHGDPSVSEAVGRRMGAEVVDRIVEPLLGGINAGRADNLSLAAVAPQLSYAARERSLMAGVTGLTPGEGPVFAAVDGGLERLIEGLASEVDVRAGSPVEHLGDLDADHVVLAVAAPAAACLLRPLSPVAADELDAIEHASVTVVTLGYEPSAVPGLPEGSGFLVPRVDGRLMSACTFLTSKWPSLQTSGLVLLRASAGRFGDDRAIAMDDEALTRTLHGELAEALGLQTDPVITRVDRWPDGFPQYAPGHLARVDHIEAALPAHVTVAGAPYRGVGIAACVRQAAEAADRIATTRSA